MFIKKLKRFEVTYLEYWSFGAMVDEKCKSKKGNLMFMIPKIHYSTIPVLQNPNTPIFN